MRPLLQISLLITEAANICREQGMFVWRSFFCNPMTVSVTIVTVVIMISMSISSSLRSISDANFPPVAAGILHAISDFNSTSWLSW